MKNILLLALLAGNALFAQNIISINNKNIDRGIIYKKDKTQIEGIITTPLSAYQKKLKIRSAGENINIKSQEIDSIIYPEKHHSTLVFTATEYFPKRKSQDKKTKRQEWLRKSVSGKLSLYETTYVEHRKEHSKSTTFYFLKRENETLPVQIGTKINEPFPNSDDRTFRINLEKYFADEPEFLYILKEKEYSLNELPLLCEKYNKWKIKP